MSDHIELIHGRAPKRLIWENGAAYSPSGVTWFENYDPEKAPATKPKGAVSRFQVPNAVAMPANRAVGIALCDRFEALIPKLSDKAALFMARQIHAQTDYEGDEERTSLLRTGYRIGQTRRMELLARKALVWES